MSVNHRGAQKVRSTGVGPLERAKSRRIELDIQSGRIDVEDLLNQVRELTAANATLKRQVSREQWNAAQSREDATAAKKEVKRLAARYEKQTARVEKFKGAYDSMRRKPLVRAANLLSDPERVLRKLGVPADRNAQQPPALSAGPTVKVSKTELGAVAGVATASTTLSTDPAVDALSEMRRILDIDGNIRGAIAYLEAISGRELSAAEADWKKRLESQVSVWEKHPLLPPRSANPGYQVTPGTVMYCAHSTAEFHSNGYSTRTAHLVAALASTGSNVFVAARPGYPWDTKSDRKHPVKRRLQRDVNGVSYRYNPGLDWTRTPLDVYVQQAADTYVREAQSERAAVIHAASNYYTALPALIAARRLGIPFVYEVRGLWEITELAAKGEAWESTDKFQLAKDLESFVATQADHVLAITEEVRDELVRRGVESRRVTLLPNAADTAMFVPAVRDKELVTKHRLAPDTFVLGYAGSMVEYEGLDLLIEAFAQVHVAIPNSRLILVGDGKERPRLVQQVQELGLGAAVTFTGKVKPADVQRYLTLFDVAPCPRRSNVVTEMVSPLKPLEAMSAGIAVVGSNVAPIKHLLGEDGARGLIVPADDADALAEALIQLGQNLSLRTDMGRAARAWAAEHRSWEAAARLARASHAELESAAWATATTQVESQQALRLADVRLGLIADEFTFASFAPECQTVALYPDTWADVVHSGHIDALLVESAWSGNGGAWTRGVGYYSDEEIAPLRSLVEACQAQGIPTIFWNKEDPVHTARFLPTAALFEHVFTTDAECIPRYAANGPVTRTVSALPFFAQARLHHPLPVERVYDHSVAYGGSYYGDKYPDRSAELARILGEVSGHGLTIYDRQVNHPNSPYHFPDELKPYVQGGLDYEEMVQAYKSHPIHINVNSVDASPTMFSRRVMELAGCGTPVISGRGRGVTTLFGPLLPLAAAAGNADLLADYWLNDEVGRNFDAWRLHRHVYRAHLATHRLLYMLRTAGLAVEAAGLPAYVLELAQLDSGTAAHVLAQTHPPQAVRVQGSIEDAAVSTLTEHGIRVLSSSDQVDGLDRAWLGEWVADPDAAEDLARTLWIGRINDGEASVATAQIQDNDVDVQGQTLLVRRAYVEGLPWFGAEPSADMAPLVARRARTRSTRDGVPRTRGQREAGGQARTVLVAGHDLKFAKGLLNRLEASGHRVLIDQWQDHAKHDAAQSKALLASADVVFCEWSLGNAEWYSKHVRPDQRLVVRFHSQELFTPYPKRTESGRFDAAIYVGRLVQDMAESRFGYPESVARVIPNAVDPALFEADKEPDARFNLGLVGIVPQQKHLDRALDVLRELRREEPRFRLFIKGKTPADYPWMLKREDEMAFYDAQYARIENDPLLTGAVYFDGHGDDMAQWYRKIGVVLSVSDFESFHLTLADGGASGALPVSLAWPGAEHIYPREWLHLTVESMAQAIAEATQDEERFEQAGRDARQYCQRFHGDRVLADLEAAVIGEK